MSPSNWLRSFLFIATLVDYESCIEKINSMQLQINILNRGLTKHRAKKLRAIGMFVSLGEFLEKAPK